MKNTKTRKRFLTLISALCLFAFGIVTFNTVVSSTAYAAEQNNITEPNDTSERETYEFHPTIEKFSYGLDEPFSVSFIIESKSPAISVSYTTDGFIVTQSPVIDKDTVSARIKYNGNASVMGT